MSNDFAKLMSEKSDEGLQKYLDNTSKFVPESTEAAIAEFQTRGRKFSEEELAFYKGAIAQQRVSLENEEAEFWKRSDVEKENIVADTNAPLFYSKRVVNGCTIAFGVLFGAILLATNMKKTKSSKGIIPTIAFGLVFSFVQIWLSIATGSKSNSSLLVNSGCAIILQYIFWEKYIGVGTPYRARPFWVPVIIGILMSAAVIGLKIYGS